MNSERDLIDHLATDPAVIEYGLELKQKKFDTGSVGCMDLLCVDRDQNHVLVETDKGEESRNLIGQIQRYLDWIEENLAKTGEKVRAIIIVDKLDGRLNYDVPGNDSIQLKYYETKFEA